MAPRSGVQVLANRGANGIDGFVSTVIGVASAHPGPVVALPAISASCTIRMGSSASARRPAVTIVVVDNDGGGIFAYLPQQHLPEFEMLFATPQSVDLVAVARAHGVAAGRVEYSALPGLLAETPTEARVLVVPVDRGAAREQHARIWAAVATSIG